jgi:hypothetical protein
MGKTVVLSNINFTLQGNNMARNYRGYAYFDNNPNIVKIFDDLEALLDFCRWELLPYNQADLYNKESDVWKRFLQANRNHYKGRNNNNYRKHRDR